MKQNKQLNGQNKLTNTKQREKEKFKKDDLQYGDEHICIQNVSVRKWTEAAVNFPGLFTQIHRYSLTATR